MSQSQLTSIAGFFVAVGGALATAGGFIHNSVAGVIVVAVGAGIAAAGDSILGKK